MNYFIDCFRQRIFGRAVTIAFLAGWCHFPGNLHAITM